MGIDWEDILGNDVEDLQDAYDSLVYDSGKYLSDDYDDDSNESNNDKSDVPEPKPKYRTPGIEEAFTLPF